MKLFRVEIERSMIVYAKDEQSAQMLARRHERDELGLEEPGLFAREITDERQIDPEWRDSVPYGDDQNRTCLQIWTGQP